MLSGWLSLTISRLQRGFNYTPAAVFTAQAPDANGTYVFPPEEYSGMQPDHPPSLWYVFFRG